MSNRRITFVSTYVQQMENICKYVEHILTILMSYRRITFVPTYVQQTYYICTYICPTDVLHLYLHMPNMCSTCFCVINICTTCIYCTPISVSSKLCTISIHRRTTCIYLHGWPTYVPQVCTYVPQVYIYVQGST